MKKADFKAPKVRKRILISAYACSPSEGSEPGVGWGFVREMAMFFEVHVIVEEVKFRLSIEHWLNKNLDDPAHEIKFHFIAKKRNRKLRKIWPPSYYWFYRKWHIDAAHLAADLDDKYDFALMHQLTMVGYREPGFLWQTQKPFIWGPVGGAGVLPWAFFSEIEFKAALYYLGYNLFNIMQFRFASRPRRASRRASSGLIAATTENQSAMLKHWGQRSVILSEIGIDAKKIQQPRSRQVGEPLKILWSGKFLPRKGLSIALEALALLPDECNWELNVLGNGALDSQMRKKADVLGIVDKCHFHGWLERAKAVEISTASHLAIVTSLRDLTSSVIIEALQMALPVIAPSHCGFTDAITEDCGVLVSIESPEALKNGIAKEVKRLLNDDAIRYKLAEGAVVRAQSFDWQKKGTALKAIYEDRLAEVLTVQGGKK